MRPERRRIGGRSGNRYWSEADTGCMEDTGLLNNKGMMTLIVLISRYPGTAPKELAEMVGLPCKTAEQRLEDLKGAKLIGDTQKPILTETGKEVAAHLEKINDLLQNAGITGSGPGNQ